VLTSLQRALNRFLQRLLGLVQLLLDLHDAVSIVRVLELFDVPPKVSLRLAVLVGLQSSLVRPRRLGELAGELVQDLAQQLVCYELVVGLVGDDDAGASLAAGVDVDGELVLGLGLARAWTGRFGDGAVDLTADFADAVAGSVLLVGLTAERYECVWCDCWVGYTNLPRVKREKCSSMVSTQHSSTAGLLSFCQICFRRSALLSLPPECSQGMVGVRRRMRYPWWRCCYLVSGRRGLLWESDKNRMVVFHFTDASRTW